MWGPSEYSSLTLGVRKARARLTPTMTLAVYERA